jgi:hypothetical protein
MLLLLLLLLLLHVQIGPVLGGFLAEGEATTHQTGMKLAAAATCLFTLVSLQLPCSSSSSSNMKSLCLNKCCP